MPWTFFNSNGQRLSSAVTNINVLDIDGATDIGAAIVDADLFIIDDGAGGANRKTAASRIKTYVNAITTRTIFMPPGPVHTNGVYEPNRLALIKLPVDVMGTVNFTFQVPANYSSHSESTAIQLVWYTNAGTTNNMYGRFGSYGQGATESVEGTSEVTSEEVMAAGGNKIINVSNKPDALDLSGIAIGDYIGIDFRRNGAHASDTISDDVRVIGMLFTYTASQ